MIRPLNLWRVLATLATLSVGRGLDSVNLDLEVLENIDLSALGIPNLDLYGATYNLTVDGTSCQYLLQIDFKKNPLDRPGPPNFQGECATDGNTGTAEDELGWHDPRRHWLQFPEYVYDTTGFNHMSLYWSPCGKAPLGLRQGRYELNFYPVIPQYRAFMTCQEFKTPSVCQYNQTNHVGRAHFSIPRVLRDPNFLANMPVGFQPDPQHPEAFQYEGLIHYDAQTVPNATEDWILPTFVMSTYDGDVASWRALIPHSFIAGDDSSIFSSNQFYVHQTMMQLPSHWNMTYDGPTGLVSVFLQGTAGICGSPFDQVKAEQESGVVFDDGGADNAAVGNESQVLN